MKNSREQFLLLYLTSEEKLSSVFKVQDRNLYERNEYKPSLAYFCDSNADSVRGVQDSFYNKIAIIKHECRVWCRDFYIKEKLGYDNYEIQRPIKGEWFFESDKEFREIIDKFNIENFAIAEWQRLQKVMLSKYDMDFSEITQSDQGKSREDRRRWPIIFISAFVIAIVLGYQLYRESKSDIELAYESSMRSIKKTWGDKAELSDSPVTVVYSDDLKSRFKADFKEKQVTVEIIVDKEQVINVSDKIALTHNMVGDLLNTEYSDPIVSFLNKSDSEFNQILLKDVIEYDFIEALDPVEDKKLRLVRPKPVFIARKTQILDEERMVVSGTYQLSKKVIDTTFNAIKKHVCYYAAKLSIEPQLIFAIIEAESSFNPIEVSHAGAYGLMQVVPSTAGEDVKQFLISVDGKQEVPTRLTKGYLFNPANNIEYGVTYLYLLQNRYFPRVKNKLGKDYVVISAYNAGPGAISRLFYKSSSSSAKVAEAINRLTNIQIKNKILLDAPKETQGYLTKVINFKRKYSRSECSSGWIMD